MYASCMLEYEPFGFRPRNGSEMASMSEPSPALACASAVARIGQYDFE